MLTDGNMACRRLSPRRTVTATWRVGYAHVDVPQRGVVFRQHDALVPCRPEQSPRCPESMVRQARHRRVSSPHDPPRAAASPAIRSLNVSLSRHPVSYSSNSRLMRYRARSMALRNSRRSSPAPSPPPRASRLGAGLRHNAVCLDSVVTKRASRPHPRGKPSRCSAV